MKKIILGLIVSLSLSQAFGYRGGELDMKCESVRGAQNAVPVKVLFRQLDQRSFVEGQKVPFELVVQTQGANKVVSKFNGIVETEDVMVFFNTQDQRVHVTFFLDEMDQNSLKIFGQEYLLNCEYLRPRW